MQERDESQRSVKTQEKELAKKLKFANNSGFQAELRRRVDELFQNGNLKERDCPQMYTKTAILLLGFFGTYAVLVLLAQSWWQVGILCIVLGVITAGIGFSIQHDGAHHAYSNSLWVNKLMAMSLDVIGGSSYIWHWKHDVLHHTYVNIAGYDMDLEVGIFGRLSPTHAHLPFHRWQHYYLWLLYGLLAIKWHFYDDFYCLITGKIGDRPYPRPKRSNLAIFFVGKGIFLSLVFGIPLLLHSFGQVFASYVLVAVTLGIVLSVVFQLAHVVEEANFPVAKACVIENDWAIHQIETTVNFSRNNPYVTWLLGGLNFQVEHHLFPNICHINYPEVSKVVEQTCQEFGVRYNQHGSVWAGFRSHFRWLRRMGTCKSL
ncbi:fatty acid desaturase family protein [Pseudanabaena sp. UWO310]|uniref:fatty acid desaturase family protein n=1 Tax=Pseudanabaena sp. UWO310 TaxID=2480795 RepID=UPI00115AE418|nr:acyl-CoA desaturase [Pseudanabaena sp. UWO310]TYQ31036.1 acyl-CoA desaturase [Pseudanabaena sp. UWO310]